MKYYKWSRYNGYEVSTAGDKRFSAFNAILEDGRSIEQWYQCDIKGYDPNGTNWRLGKGKQSLIKYIDLYEEYKNLWKRWAQLNPNLINELKTLAKDKLLSDKFATTSINQARALAEILNEQQEKETDLGFEM